MTILTPLEVIERLSAAAPPGLRTAPLAGSGGVNGTSGRVRGDHDLSPELYDPAQSLKPAAVLVPIVAHETEPTILLTKRTDHLYDHAGQISFPGGRIDPGDSGPEAAALREVHEEIGLEGRHIKLIGRLDTYVVRTGFEVTPVVGLVHPPFELALDAFEVAQAFEVPLSFFLTPGTKQRQSRIFKGKERFFYVYPYGDHYIWGATAGMLGNLAEILNPDLVDH